MEQEKQREQEALEAWRRRTEFQENYLENRKILLQEREQLIAQIAKINERLETIDRNLNGWDLTLMHHYEE